MALTYGFFNSKNGDRRYNALQFGSIFDGIIDDGVYSTIGDGFMVTSDENGLKVKIGTGRAWFNHTWTLNTSVITKSLDAATGLQDRWDTIMLQIDWREDNRKNSIEIKKGTPGDPPQKPNYPDDFYNTDTLKQVPLAYVRVRAGYTYIKSTDIDCRVGHTECPLVIAPVIGHMTADDLLENWTIEYGRYTTEMRNRWTAFQLGMEADIERYESLMETSFTDWIDLQKQNYDEFMDHNFIAWRTWFENIQYQLDSDVAGHLQTQIDEIAKFKDIYVVDKVLYVPMSGASVSGKKLIFAT